MGPLSMASSMGKRGYNSYKWSYGTLLITGDSGPTLVRKTWAHQTENQGGFRSKKYENSWPKSVHVLQENAAHFF